MILFTKRKKTGLLFRSLANKFHKNLIFIEIFYKDALVNKFKIKRFPTIGIIEDSLNYKLDIFTKENNMKNLTLFIKQNLLK